MSGDSSSFKGILTTNTVCVNNIEAKNGDDLTIQSKHKIVLKTPNLLINNLRINRYIENFLFNQTPPHEAVRHEKITNTADKIDITNAGTTELQMLDVMKISSYSSYTVDDSFTNDKNRQHYINLISASGVNINVPNFNETTGDFSGYTNSVIYMNEETENTLQNYIYELVNSTTQKTRVYSPISYFEDADNVYDFEVTKMGEYYTKTIETSNVSTFNISSNNTQPGLTIESESAINIMANSFFINGSNVNDIIKSSLDETASMFTINITPTNGLNISFVIDSFTSVYDNFVYDVKFDIVDRDYPDVIVNTLTVTDIFSKVPSGPYIFNNLTEGVFYNIVATVTNTFTNKQIANVNMSPNASSIVAIETENFTININTTVNEANNSISFTFDQTAIQKGFDVNSDLNHDYDIVFTITQNSNPSLTFNTQTVNNVRKGVTPTSTYTFVNLINKGETYSIIASTIANNVTSIQVSNVYVTDVYFPSVPTLTLSESLTYNNTNQDRQFYVTITVVDYNGGFTISGTPTLTDAVYNETIGNDVFFTFNNDISPGIKLCNISISDDNDSLLGGPKTASNSKTYELTITFANVPNVINLFQTRLLNYNSSSVTTIESYAWKKDGVVLLDETTSSIIVDNENATYECSIIQINDENTGFRRSLSTSITITLPEEITNGLFNIINLYTYTYQYTYNGNTYNDDFPYNNSVITINGDPPENHIPFSVDGSKSCDVTIYDPYGFFQLFNIGSFDVSIPTSVSGITLTNIGPHSITINWSDRGSDGTPVDTLETIKMYYNIGNDVSNDISNYVGSIEASGTSSTSISIEYLSENTVYSFIIEKKYSNYGSISTSIQTFQTKVKILPSLNNIYIANDRIYWDIDLGTASLVRIKYQKYNQSRSSKSQNHHDQSRTYYVYNFLLNSSSTYESVTIQNNNNTGTLSALGNQSLSSIYNSDITRVSLSIEADSYHLPILQSGIFSAYRSDKNGYHDAGYKFKHINFLFRTYDSFIHNRGTDNGKFAMIVHDNSHEKNTVLITTPLMSWKNNDVRGSWDVEDLYSIEGLKSPNFENQEYEISELGIKDFVNSTNVIQYNFLAIKNTSDYLGNTSKYGSAGSTYFKISKTTIGIFLTKIYWVSTQYKDRFYSPKYYENNQNNWAFQPQNIEHTGNYYSFGYDVTNSEYATPLLYYDNGGSIPDSLKSQYTRIYVYRDRITSGYLQNIPLVTVWLDKENGDIPWNDGVNNAIPAIAPDPPVTYEVGGDYVTLSWNPNPNNDAIIQNYKVNRVNSNGTIIETRTTNAGANNRYKWTGLVQNTTYYFTVTKVTNLGEYCSYPSPYFYCPSISAYDSVNTTIDINNDTEYDKLRKDYLNPGVTQIYTGPSYFSVFDGTQYDEFYANVPFYGNGIMSVTTLFSGTDASPPNTLTGTPSDTSVSLSWNAGNNNDANFISYTVNRENVDGSIITSVQNMTTTSYTWTGLNAGQQYYFTVQKVTDRGTTTKSNQLSVRTNDIFGTDQGTPSLQTRNLKSVTFKWSPGDIGSGTLVRHNLVRYNDSGGTSVYSRHESTGFYQGNISILWPEDLESYTNYYFRSERIVNYSGSEITTYSPSVFTFSYNKVMPSPALLFKGGDFTKSSSSFQIGFRLESDGDYTLEKIVIHWVNDGYTYVSYGSNSFEDRIWNTVYTLPSYTDWYGFSIQSEQKEIYPNELENYATTSYGTLGYVYEFVLNNPDNAVTNYTYDIVVEKVYSDLNLSEYTYNGVNNIPVISRSYPYSTGSGPFKGIAELYASFAPGSPRGIFVTISLTGLDSEIISSITYYKDVRSLYEYHITSEYPDGKFSEQIVVTNPTREVNDVYSAVFLPESFILVNNAEYSLGAIVETDVDTYVQYISFIYTT